MIITTAATLAFSGETIHKLPTLGITSSPQISHQSLSNKSEPTSPKIQANKIKQATPNYFYQVLQANFGRHVQVCIPNRGCTTIVPQTSTNGYPHKVNEYPIIASVDFRQVYNNPKIFGQLIIKPFESPYLMIDAVQLGKNYCPTGSLYVENILRDLSTNQFVSSPFCKLPLIGIFAQ